MTNKISIVVPVYNEESNIRIFLDRLNITLKKINEDYEIIFVLDPSTDNTEKIIKDAIKENKKIKLITLSRKFGQPASTMAGIMNVSGDKCVIIDCDLQDPPELIYEMNMKINEGYDVVEMNQFRPGANYAVFRKPGKQNPVIYGSHELNLE